MLLFMQFFLSEDLDDDSSLSIHSMDIIITNNFKHPISLFYDDHESGAFLSTLHTKETVALEATPEQGNLLKLLVR